MSALLAVVFALSTENHREGGIQSPPAQHGAGLFIRRTLTRLKIVNDVCNGGTTARRLGRRGPFEVDYFHATPIGLMLDVENIARTSPRNLANYLANYSATPFLA